MLNGETRLRSVFEGGSSRDILTWILPFWALSRLALSGWGALVWSLGLAPGQSIGYDFYFGVDPIVAGWRGALLGVWQRWDAIHYIRIAQEGYVSPMLSAYFPAYPIIGHGLGVILGSAALLALLVISNLALLGACILLYQIAQDEFSPEVARAAVAGLLLFPTAFYLFAPYPVSLSLLFVLLAYWAARHGRWWLAALGGLASGLTHSTVLPLVLALGWMAVSEVGVEKSRNRWLILMAPLGPALGVGAFMAWRAWIGFPAYSELLLETWGRGLQPPWLVLRDFVRLLGSDSWWITGWLDVATATIAVVGLAWGIRRLPVAMLLYQGGLILLLLSSTTRFDGWGRYALIMFPVFILGGLWLRSGKGRLIGFAIGLGLQLYFSAQFFMWIWTG